VTQRALARSEELGAPAGPSRSTAAAPWRRGRGASPVYILPTGQGWGFAAALLFMLVGAINYDNSLAYVLVFLLASLALVAMVHTHRNLAGLKLREGRVAAVFAGEVARFSLCLDNRNQGERTALELLFGPQRQQRRRLVQEVSVPADVVHCVELPVTTQRRGPLALGRVSIATRFPLGLFRAWTRRETHMRCLVYPHPSGALPLPAPLPRNDTRPGPAGPGQDDFSGLRPYARGDSLRQVHWKAAAGGRGLHVKLFAGGGGGDLLLRWSEAGNGDTETRLAQICRWVLEAERQGKRYGLELPGVSFAPDHGEAHVHRCLGALALYAFASD
jgi:uncharacterized protein (DUF58 family)